MNTLSRRGFMKGSALGFLALGGVNALASIFNIESTQPSNRLCCSYLIYEPTVCDVSVIARHIKANKILSINGDIAPIYADIKAAFQANAFIASVSSETSFFVLTQMARNYQYRLIFNDIKYDARAFILAPKGAKI